MKQKITNIQLFLLLLVGFQAASAQQLSTRFGINTKGWYFGDKAGIKFTSNGTIAVGDNISRNLQIFARTNLIYDHLLDTVQAYSTGFCFFNQINFQVEATYPSMWNCDSSTFTGGNPFTIIPSTSDSSLFYIFSINSYTNSDCYLNWAGIQFNGQNFDLVSEDTMLIPNYLQQDFGIVRHGNGRDFWVLLHRIDNYFSNEYLSVLFSDGEIAQTFVQNIGTSSLFPLSIQFNHTGDKVAMLNFYPNPNQTTVSELYDFDRCTGLLSNLDTIRVHQSYASGYGFGVFSPNDSLLYISSYDTLFQYQIYTPNISASEVVIQTADPDITLARKFGEMQLGPDKKLYISIFNGAQANYIDSIVGYLDVIHYPDLVGTACTYQPYAVYLDGNRAMGTLPYIYEYDKGPLLNSPCDTLTTTSISEQRKKPQITLAPNPAQTQATLIWSGMQEGIFVLRDMLGRAVLSEQLNRPSGTIRLNLSTLPKGIYLWQVQSTAYSKNGKLVVE